MPADFIAGRSHLIEALREEVVGPVLKGTPVDCVAEVNFARAEDAYGPFVQASTGDEVVHRDTPLRRYGVGVLYPSGLVFDAEAPSETEESALPDAEAVTDELGDADQVIAPQLVTQLADATETLGGARDEEPEELDLSGANLLRPSTVAVSLLCALPDGARVVVRAGGGRYTEKVITVTGSRRQWWLRRQVALEAVFDARSLLETDGAMIHPDHIEGEGLEDLDLRVEIRSRPDANRRSLLTVCLINRTATMSDTLLDSRCLFQSAFTVRVEAPSGDPCIVAYPDLGILGIDDPEAESIALLYRDQLTFGVGHGCAAEWSTPTPEGRVVEVRAEPFPIVETPSVTPDIMDADGQPITVSMGDLAGVGDSDRGMADLERLVASYERWIDRKRGSIDSLTEAQRGVASRHLEECSEAVRRMREGLALLQGAGQGGQVDVRLAFELTNLAMLQQQLHQRRGVRRISTSRSGAIRFDEDFEEPDLSSPPSGRGSWRAFQIAFVLMSIPSIVDGNHPDRERVELIWFPTGGGKTEAYLGLTAMSIFLRRLRSPDATGVEVLMRYTLRLLTAQQFQRASGLLCAMELIRREHPIQLGGSLLSIGIWLGRGVTPNRRADAVAILRTLQKGRSPDGGLLLTRCPWCSVEIGTPVSVSRGSWIVPGLEEDHGRVRFRCPDPRCAFSGPDGLPILVVDEDLYESPPSLLIGTVDKFAMLAWEPRARTLFGIGDDGNYMVPPPGLVIQDELHLISGPLGSMVGLYEAVIEDLCTNRQSDGTNVRAKIISSTATIRRYEEQIKGLYARSSVSLFPPPGLESNDSFFARWATDSEGNRAPGRVYVGLHAPNLPSMMTTQVRTYAALLQGAADLEPEARDPWWTMMSFFSSLRELGNALTLFQSDVPDYLITVRNRLSIARDALRRLWNVEELTSRLSNDEIPKMLEKLEVVAGSERPYPVDACLASTIVEVGVDIDRLSLMTILGQPKTTSTYIQVTGRIGRQWWNRPGLVVTMFNPNRPRDRSHFERFRTYHERLYAQVEPTTVTPFSPPALDRALHALMVIYARHRGVRTEVDSPWPPPDALLDTVHDLLVRRVKDVDPSEQEELERVFARRRQEWLGWERTEWGRPFIGSADGLLRSPMSYASGELGALSWATPTSLRNVDAECIAEISVRYAMAAGGDDASG
jgi:hypothetical protein